MKESLIQKAKKLGFTSDIHEVHEAFLVADGGDTKKLLYYLWMCELQKYLREKYGFLIMIDITGGHSYYYKIYDLNSGIELEDLKQPYENSNYKKLSYKEVLEKGLFEALKLI